MNRSRRVELLLRIDSAFYLVGPPTANDQFNWPYRRWAKANTPDLTVQKILKRIQDIYEQKG